MVGLAFLWLFFETDWLRVRLPCGAYSKKDFDIGSILMMGIGMVFVAVGLILLRFNHRPFPAVLISPKGEHFFVFNANQAKHICQRLNNWRFELAPVLLLSPEKVEYRMFNGVQAERIVRQHPDWSWREIINEQPPLSTNIKKGIM
jgi:hypothetical protein